MELPSFPEKLSRFLRSQLEQLGQQHGEDSPRYLGLARQYIKDPREDVDGSEQNLKHYEAGLTSHDAGELPPGLERLYRRTLVIEPTLACISNCRYCLRSNYRKHTLTEKQLVEVAQYCGKPPVSEILNEVLITGGDPLLIPHRVAVLLDALEEHAPNIRIIRLASRIPSQDPERIDEDVLQLFRNRPRFRFELATQINHPVEFFPETVEAFRRIRSVGAKIYSQNVLLKGVNDDLATLTELYDTMRWNDIEAHYLFHSVPLIGTHHLRTSVARGVRLASALTSCGAISGRAKPMYAAMTDIGKITLYDGAMGERRDGRVLLQSNYKLEDRLTWNPSWQLPSTAEVDDDGYLRVWYLDGED
jgi:lysine 2,3-aminomutase